MCAQLNAQCHLTVRVGSAAAATAVAIYKSWRLVTPLGEIISPVTLATLLPASEGDIRRAEPLAFATVVSVSGPFNYRRAIINFDQRFCNRLAAVFIFS